MLCFVTNLQASNASPHRGITCELLHPAINFVRRGKHIVTTRILFCDKHWSKLSLPNKYDWRANKNKGHLNVDVNFSCLYHEMKSHTCSGDCIRYVHDEIDIWGHRLPRERGHWKIYKSGLIQQRAKSACWASITKLESQRTQLDAMKQPRDLCDARLLSNDVIYGCLARPCARRKKMRRFRRVACFGVIFTSSVF